jgi:PAS domain S-box-containing protein
MRLKNGVKTMPMTLRLLVLEDNPNDAELEIAELKEAGYNCDWERVETREDFLARLDEAEYDLILSDYSLPAFDGLTALRLVMERKIDTPFILVSGTLGEETAIESLKSGATDYVLKNRLSRLGPVVRRALAEQGERRERKRADVALRESEERFRTVCENAPALINAFDKDGQCTFWNQQCRKTFGWTIDEINAPDKAMTLFYPDPAICDEVIRSVTSDPDGDFKEWHPLTKAGKTLTTIWANFRVPGGLVFNMGYDITDRKQAEEKLRKSESRLVEAQHIANMGDFTWEVETGKVTWSEGLYDLLGYDKFEIMDLRKVNAKIHHPDDQERITSWLNECLESGKSYHPLNQYRLIHKDGNSLDIQTTISVKFKDGKPFEMMGTIQDITERKQAEEEKEKLESQLLQAQKMEAVGRLAGGVAHDFNNMLGVILGHAEMALAQMKPGQPFHADLTEIQKAGMRSADLTRQLLAFARKQIVAPKVIDLNKTVASMTTMLQRLIGEDINLAWVPDDKLWAIKIDPSQIDQILANLCVNARDAIADVGKVTIETGNTTFDDEYCADHAGFNPGEYVLLAVSDDGCGMNSETQSNLFEPFFTTKELGKGTGLGLATVYGAVKQNNGFINVYSEPGQGTTFKIYLPRHLAKPSPLPDKGPNTPAKRGHETILLVEDELAILGMATMMLEREGYTVVAAGTPGEAIELVHAYSDEIHLLITDVVMPEMNGRDLARNLLNNYPNLKRLFMSGYTADVIAHHGVLDEGVNFIQKPFSKKDLTVKVREVLERE